MLKVEDVSGGYGAVPVLHQVSLDVGRGEMVALIGANNAGKSTLLKIIAGLHKGTSGRVILDGAELNGLPPHEIVNRGVVMVPEGRGLFPEMTVEENLLLGSYNRRAKPERVARFEQVFDLFPVLRERRNQEAKTLSGGEQQMLALGRALMAKPEVLLLDEPSLGLAPVRIRDLYAVIGELNRSGLTVLLVEQNMKLALKVSSRAYVLLHGRVCRCGECEQLAQDDGVIKACLGIAE